MFSSGYEPDYTDEEKIEQNLLKWKWVSFFFNAIIFFIALATFGVCLWVR